MPFLIKRSRLKSLLRNRGKTQRWLAEAVDVPFQRINEYANDRLIIPMETAKNCVDVLGLSSIDELFEWEEISPSEWKKKRKSRQQK